MPRRHRPSTPGRSARPAGAGPSRRDRLTTAAARERAASRRRTLLLLGVCLAAAMALLAYPVYLYVQDARRTAVPRDEIGVAAAAAGCLPVERTPARGNQEHVPDGTIVQYDRLPPDSGPHLNQWAPFDTKFYTMADRPAVENLVHNLEHGYVLAWYRDTLAQDQVEDLRAIAATFRGSDPDDKFIAAPWSPTIDGGDFPDGTNLVLARWVADPADPQNQAAQAGVRLACASVSGEAIAQFRSDYPVSDSPEPAGG